MLISASSFAQEQEYEIVYEYDSTQNVSINTDHTEETNVEFGIDCYGYLPTTPVAKRVKVLTYDIRNNRVLIHNNSDSEAIKVKSFIDRDRNGGIIFTLTDLLDNPLLELTEKAYSRLTQQRLYSFNKLEGFDLLIKMNNQVVTINSCEDIYKF